MRKPQTNSEQQHSNHEDSLWDARSQALKKGDITAPVEANQELWKFYPRIYQHLIGPVYERHREAGRNCYCNNPRSLSEICNDINNDTVPNDALDCDDCWQIDLLSTWMFYEKTIPSENWKQLCELRGIYQLFPD